MLSTFHYVEKLKTVELDILITLGGNLGLFVGLSILDGILYMIDKLYAAVN